MILHKYENGNCTVTLHTDGRKIREWPDGEEPRPDVPESVDLKITNQCMESCAWCHESSFEDGKPAYVGRITSVLEGLPAGVEIAIGGGNAHKYDDLFALLLAIRAKGLVASMTVQASGVIECAMLVTLQKAGLLHGLGVSDAYLLGDMLRETGLSHVVCHAIAGVDEPFDVIGMRRNGSDVLILGYKRYGRGADYYDDNSEAIENNLARWRYFLGPLLRSSKGVLSFDNLALQQLDVKQRIPAEVWAKHYMGDDGKFTMYYDAVRNEYAASSISERCDAGGMTLVEMFQRITWGEQEGDESGTKA